MHGTENQNKLAEMIKKNVIDFLNNSNGSNPIVIDALKKVIHSKDDALWWINNEMKINENMQTKGKNPLLGVF